MRLSIKEERLMRARRRAVTDAREESKTRARAHLRALLLLREALELEEQRCAADATHPNDGSQVSR